VAVAAKRDHYEAYREQQYAFARRIEGFDKTTARDRLLALLGRDDRTGSTGGQRDG